jgi:hypothetical protein
MGTPKTPLGYPPTSDDITALNNQLSELQTAALVPAISGAASPPESAIASVGAAGSKMYSDCLNILARGQQPPTMVIACALALTGTSMAKLQNDARALYTQLTNVR